MNQWAACHEMREGASIDQAENPSRPEAPQIAPQSPIAQPRDVAVLGERPFPLHDGPNSFVAREGVAVGLCIAEEEVKLEHTSRLMRHRFLLPHQQSAKHVREGSYYAESLPQSDFNKDRVLIFCRLHRSNPYRRFADTPYRLLIEGEIAAPFPVEKRRNRRPTKGERRSPVPKTVPKEKKEGPLAGTSQKPEMHSRFWCADCGYAIPSCGHRTIYREG